MNPVRCFTSSLIACTVLSICAGAHAWEIVPTELAGSEGQSVGFDIVVEEEDWAPAGTVCDEAVWDFEFQLDGTLIDGTAKWGLDLSSPFSGGALTGICHDDEEELVTPYTIALIEDFTPEDIEDAEIFFEHCEEPEGEGAVTCTDETLAIEIIEFGSGGLPVVGIIKINDGAEPLTHGRFGVFLEAPAPDGGLTVHMNVSGTALPGVDYNTLLPSIFIPEGATEVFRNVDVINDNVNEGTETVIITLLEDPDYMVSFQLERITVLIVDDDGAGPDLEINQGISDAWFNPATDGQGFFIIVFPQIGKIFMAWFTYDTQRPPANVQAFLGDPGHRWLTAFGDYAGNKAVLGIEITEGGIFNAVPPETTQSPDGTITLEFLNCTSGLVHYTIPSIGRSGTVPIQRLTSDNVGLCQQQNNLTSEPR